MRFSIAVLLSFVSSSAFAQESDYAGLYVGLRTGIWMPRGELAIVGSVKPHLGVELGLINKGWTYGFNFYGIVAERSAQLYTTLHRDTLRTTRYFTQGGFGLLVERSVWQKKRVAMAIGGGVGRETVTTVEDSDRNDDEDNGKDIPTLALSCGPRLTYLAWPCWSFSLYSRYHAVRFRNDGGTPLTGNTWTAGVMVRRLQKERVGN